MSTNFKELNLNLDIGPVTRIEGHLEFKLGIDDGRVKDARASAALFRGFEIMLKGRRPMDALGFVPRICGVCPTPHSIACAKTLDDLFKAEVPPNAHLFRSILLGVENIMSHATHFYALFGPDLVNKKYSGHKAYPLLQERFTPLQGSSYLKAIKARVKLDEVYAILGGQHPHSNVFVPGGVTYIPQLSDITKVTTILIEVQGYIEETILGSSVEEWLNNNSLADVEEWMGRDGHEKGDLGVFIKYAPELGMAELGKGVGRFVTYGVYDQEDGQPWLKRGFFDDNRVNELDHKKITEDVKHSWYEDYEGGKHPFQGETRPNFDKSGEKYSYAKAPRYDGKVAEVGPLARMINDGDPLLLDIYNKFGANVFTRELARLHEAVRTLAQVKIWLGKLDISKPFYIKPKPVKDGEGLGMTEAARGALAHWIRIKNGKISNYQVITPTAWNVSPMDSIGQHGPIENAVIGTPVPDEENPVEVQHVIRSFDPCIACTVHVIKEAVAK